MKTKLLRDGSERTFALVFDTGEEVAAALLRFANEEKLTGAHLTAIGAFQRVTLGFFDPAKKEYKPILIEEQVELLSLVANIARNDEGEAKLHAHVVVGKADGTAHGGHLLEALVRPTMEILVVESSQHLRRRMRDDLGAALWIFPYDRVLRFRTQVGTLRRSHDTLRGMSGLRSADQVPSPDPRRISCCPW